MKVFLISVLMVTQPSFATCLGTTCGGGGNPEGVAAAQSNQTANSVVESASQQYEQQQKDSQMIQVIENQLKDTQDFFQILIVTNYPFKRTMIRKLDPKLVRRTV